MCITLKQACDTRHLNLFNLTDQNIEANSIDVQIDAKTIYENLNTGTGDYLIDQCDLLSHATGGDRLEFFYQADQFGGLLENLKVTIALAYEGEIDSEVELDNFYKQNYVISKVTELLSLPIKD